MATDSIDQGAIGAPPHLSDDAAVLLDLPVLDHRDREAGRGAARHVVRALESAGACQEGGRQEKFRGENHRGVGGSSVSVEQTRTI